MKVIQHVSAVYVCRHHIGVALQRLGEVLTRLLGLAFVLVHIASQQGNVRLFRENVEVFRCQIQQLVVLFEVEQVVTEIDDYIPVSGQQLYRFLANYRRFMICPLEAQIPFLFPKQLRFPLHIARRAV